MWTSYFCLEEIFQETPVKKWLSLSEITAALKEETKQTNKQKFNEYTHMITNCLTSYRDLYIL